jgi:hypothetical protein
MFSCEIVRDELYFLSSKFIPEDFEETMILNIDDEYVYEPYCHDFGPFDIGKIFRFC